MVENATMIPEGVLLEACKVRFLVRQCNQDVQTNPTRMANIVDFSQFSSDLASNNVPDYSWISPDQCHDMHGRASTPSDPCDFSQVQSLIATGDAFLRSTVSAIMS